MTTIDLEDARWRAALDAELCCEATESQRQLLVDYKPRGAEHRAEQALMSALGERPSEDGEQEGDESLLAAVMESLDAQPQLGASRSGAQPFAWRALLLGAAAAVVTVGVGLLALGSKPGPQDERASSRVAKESAFIEPVRTAEVWNIASGSAVLSATGGVDAELPTDTVLEVRETLCTSNAGASLCVEPGSQVQSESSGSLALLSGSATLETSDTVESQHLLGMGTVTVEPSPHSVILLERQSAGWSVYVRRGGARVLSSTSTQVVRPGETVRDGGLEGAADDISHVSSEGIPTVGRGGDAKAPSARGAATVRPKVSALLAEARSQRRDGEMRKAIRTYQRLIESHPRSPAAQTARLSVGQLQLDAGNAKAALRSFRAYLRAPGALREDAAYGEIRALRRLGRTSAAKNATAKFNARYPTSRYGKSLSVDAESR